MRDEIIFGSSVSAIGASAQAACAGGRALHRALDHAGVVKIFRQDQSSDELRDHGLLRREIVPATLLNPARV